MLDLAILPADEALARWDGRADAWFLDGFSPALNPAMWRDEVLALVAARSAPGATAATFTVAGQVRRGLLAAGFAVEKQPGFGRKARLDAFLSEHEPIKPLNSAHDAFVADADTRWLQSDRAECAVEFRDPSQ